MRRAPTKAIVALAVAMTITAGMVAAGAGAAPSAGSDCPVPELLPGVEVGDARLRYTAACMPFVRTPDRRFRDLDGFAFTPHYATVDGLRMHYVDEGPRDGEVVLMLHGEPSWSYLYRTMVPVLADAGYRAIAVDLVGMGRSDKPVEQDAYSYLQHVAWVEEFLDVADLHDVTAFVQDWGSLIGLRVVAEAPDRFARVVVANGRLPVLPEGVQLLTLPDPPTPNPDLALSLGTCTAGFIPCFEEWATFALTGTAFRASEVVERGTASALSAEERAAYDAPFPAEIYMTAPRVFPSLLNTVSAAPTNAAARAFFDQLDRPLLTLFGRLDPNLGTDAVQAEMRDRVPGAQGQAHHAYDDAQHFIQEDKGKDLARRVAAFIAANPAA